MKKTLFVLVAAVAAMTSCVKSEVIDVAESRVIEFDPFVGKHTRTDDTGNTGEGPTDPGNQTPGATIIGTRSELKSFYVFGNIDGQTAPVFSNEAVNYVGDAQNGHYEYSGTPKVWLSGHNYYFAAVSDGNTKYDNVTYTYKGGSENNTLTISDYEVGLKDLVADIADPINTSGSMAGKETVAFDFRHMLTRVRFVINNDVSTESSVVVIENLKFVGVKTSTCNYTLTQSGNNYTHDISWSGSQTSETYQYTPADIPAPTAETLSSGKYYVIPGGSKQFGHFVIPQSSARNISFKLKTYTLQATTGGGTEYKLTDTKDCSYNLSYDNDPNNTGADDLMWQPGKVYQYAIKVAGTTSYIRFEATAQGWDWDINGDGSQNSSDDIQLGTN